MMDALQRLAVGEPWPGPLPPGEGVAFIADLDELLLLAGLDSPPPRRVRAAREGAVRVGLVPAGPHTLFLLAKIDGCLDWSSAPYALGLVREERRGLPERAPHQGRLLTVVLVDAADGIVKARRAVSLSPGFSAELERLMEGQRAVLAEFTAAAHDRAIGEAYTWFGRDADMLRAAVAMEAAGTAAAVPGRYPLGS